MDLDGNLKEAVEELIDARLKEHGLLTDAPAKSGKAGKGGKSKPKEDDEITLETVREKLVNVANDKGKDEAKKLLKKYKVDKLSELDEKHFPALAAACDALLEAGGGGEDELFE